LISKALLLFSINLVKLRVVWRKTNSNPLYFRINFKCYNALYNKTDGVYVIFSEAPSFGKRIDGQRPFRFITTFRCMYRNFQKRGQYGSRVSNCLRTLTESKENEQKVNGKDPLKLMAWCRPFTPRLKLYYTYKLAKTNLIHSRLLCVSRTRNVEIKDTKLVH